MPRKQRIDSATAAVAVMLKSGVKILPPEFEPLEECDLPYWEAVVRARARAEWTDENRIVAAKLARAMADEKRIVLELRREGDLIENGRGTMVVNPKHSLVEQLARRVMAWRKALGLDARADSRSADIAKRQSQAKAIETDLGDELLARPSVQ